MTDIVTQKNGLQTLFLQSPGSTAATVQIWFRAGSALEDKNNRGIAHFLEHMFFKGTKKRPGAKIAREVESFGGEINAFTSFDYTCYYINCPNSNISDATKILLDMVSNPLFAQDELIPERGVVFEEYRRSQDSPQQFAFQQIQSQCFQGSYASPILGTPKTIKNFSREQLISFRKRFYNTTNALLIVAGDFKEPAIVRNINQFKLPKGQATKRPTFKVKNKSSFKAHYKDVKMSTINLIFKCDSIDAPLSPAEDIALSMFAYGESSPLYHTLATQKSLINSGVGSTMFFNEGGFHSIRLTTPPEKVVTVFKELEKLIKQNFKLNFKEDELEKIKNQFIASKVYEQESLEYRAFALGSSYAGHGDIEKEGDYIERIKKVTLNDVTLAFERIFTGTLHIAVQLPLDAKKQLNKIENAAKQLQENLNKQFATKNKKIKSQKSKFDPQVELVEIKPGINLLYRHNPLTPTFILHAYIKGGLSYETTRNNGIFGLISNLLTKGNQQTDLFELKQELESLSASLNNFTGKNAYGLTMHGQTIHFSKLSEHFFNSLLNPTFAQDRVTHEKEMALRALLNRESDPASKCFEQVSQIMFPEHPYRFNTLGTVKTLETISTKQIKQTHQKQLNNSNLLFTYCGDLPLEVVLSSIKEKVSSLQSRKHPATPINTPTKIYGVTKHIEFDREQTQIFIGIPTFALTDKSNIILKLLTTYLSGQSSELFVDVRDKKGLCYSVQPVHFRALEAGYWGIYMASGHDKVEAAQEAILQLLHKLQTKGLPKSEFMRIKKMIKGQEQINIQTNDDYANIYSIPALHKLGIDWHYKLLTDIEKLTHTQFQQGLKKLLNQQWNIVTAGRS